MQQFWLADLSDGKEKHLASRFMLTQHCAAERHVAAVTSKNDSIKRHMQKLGQLGARMSHPTFGLSGSVHVLR